MKKIHFSSESPSKLARIIIKITFSCFCGKKFFQHLKGRNRTLKKKKKMRKNAKQRDLYAKITLNGNR